VADFYEQGDKPSFSIRDGVCCLDHLSVCLLSASQEGLCCME
jgi:hypothetical protein